MESSGLRLIESSYDDEDLEESEEYESAEESSDEENSLSKLDEGSSCLHFKGKSYEDLCFEDLIGHEFDTVKDVDAFYSFYSLAIGFSIRKFKLDKDKATGLVVRRMLVCSKEGSRKKKASPSGTTQFLENTNKRKCPHIRRETKCGCKARLTVRRCAKTGKFRTVDFVTNHNHDLAPPEMKSFLRSQRHVPRHARAQGNTLRKVSVRVCEAYELCVHQAGGHEFVGFTLKDLYNAVDSERRALLVDGDGQAAISFMNLKASNDPDFYCLFSVDVESRLCNLFWRDTMSMVDYDTFGDILIIDSTYKTNIYGKPLVVFGGVNNHRATVLFGLALLVDEKEETYMWCLSAFLASMKGKRPISVVSDGDEAMRNAITRLMPNARQRLCAWHIAKNVVKNVGNVDVQREFCHLIYAGLSVQEWEQAWAYMVAVHGLQNNSWVTGMYEKRDRWAEAFFRDHFFGGICTTSRCECMNRIMKKKVMKHMRLCEFLPRVHKSIDGIRYKALHDDFKSLNSSPVIGGHMRRIQEQVGKIFTHDVFLLIKDQIMFESKFVVVDQVDYVNTSSTTFEVTQYEKEERKWHVTYQNSRGSISFKCSCQLFESDGIPCCHIFSVMKAKLLSEFPESLVCKRWTREASTKKTNLIRRSANVDAVDLQIARYGQLMTDCSKLCHMASFTDEAYEEICGAFSRLVVLSQRWRVVEQVSADQGHGELHPNVIRDPEPCRTKGAQTRAANLDNQPQQAQGRGCGFCTRPGHNHRTCPLKKLSEAGGALPNESDLDGQLNASDLNYTECGTNPVFGNRGASGPGSSRTFSGYNDDAILSHTWSQNVLHHVEEARTFDFMEGHQDMFSNIIRG